MYQAQGQYDQALNQYRQALVIRREVGDRAGEGTTLNYIGGIHDSQGQYDQALNQYQQALVIAREVGDRTGEGTTLNNIGGVAGPMYETSGSNEGFSACTRKMDKVVSPWARAVRNLRSPE